MDENAKAPSRKFKVLVADDCENTRGLVELALEDEYLELQFCSDGDQAIEACGARLPDLAVLDVIMPGASGIQVCKWIKRNCGNAFIPVMLLTSQAEIDDKVNGFNCGADDYMTKPFALPELHARVKALLRIKDLTDRLQQTKNELEQKEKQLVTIQVAGAAAHELGQPLTAVLLNCELLTQLDNSKPRFGETLSAIQEQCQYMRHILRKLKTIDEYKTKNYLGDLEILDLSEG